MMVDTHAHIYLEEFNEDIEEVIQRALDGGIEKILLPNIDETTIDDMLYLEEKYEGVCYAMMGLHPCSVKKDFERQLYLVEDWLSKRDFLGVGEMGTDLYWDKTFWEQQQEAFRIQCDLALKYDKPIVIHCRDSIEETISLVKEVGKQDLRGVFHCFTGTKEQAKEISDLNFYMGLGGVATFKNGGLGDVITEIDQDKIVLETDSPYLSPVPERGKRNEPFKINFIAEKVAEFLSLTKEEVGLITTRNANDLFFQS